MRLNYQKLLKQLEQNHPNYYQLKYSQPIPTLKTVQKNLLSPDAALLNYFWGDSSLYLLSITKEAADFHELSTTQLSQQIQALINNVSQSSNASQLTFQEYISIAHTLYTDVLNDALQKLPETINHLTIIPDGLLAHLPFEILLKELPQTIQVNYSPRQLNYLLNTHTISYAYSAKLLQNAPNTSSKTPRFGGFAPSFEGQTLANSRGCNWEELAQLRYNQEEVKNICYLYQASPFTAQTATKSQFLQTITDYDILHLATHACTDDSDPMYSRIFFTDNEYLYTHELYNLRTKAQLVVLSACETGVGALKMGEGTMSLARGFAYAGCPSIVQSLWKVDDKAGSDIMVFFHQYLKQGLSKDDALRQAKIQYLNSQDSPERLHPYYWATFIQVGNRQAILSSPNNKWLWILGGVLGLLGLLWIFRKRTI